MRENLINIAFILEPEVDKLIVGWVEGERKKYINSLGYLYPDKNKELTEVDSFEKLKEAVKGFEYEKMIS